MKHKLFYIPLLIFFFLLSEEFLPKDFFGKVIGIKDGDTIEILVNSMPVRIRLYGIDCPEKRQAFGKKAMQYTAGLAFGKTVTAEVKNIDRYGRTVAVIILPDGTNLNYELVKNGYAWHYKQFSKDPNLERFEKEARQKKLGLWSDPNPIPPWEFRKNSRSSQNIKKYSTDSNVLKGQCKAITKSGKRCSRQADASGYCGQHRK